MEEIDGEEVVLAEKKREMDEKVEEILGLNATDFTGLLFYPKVNLRSF